MPMTMIDDTMLLEGICPVEEAEPLLEWLRQTAAARLDLSQCEHIHTAILQTLLAARPIIVAMPPCPVTARLLGAAGFVSDPAS